MTSDKAERAIEIQEGTWLYTRAIIGWKEDKSKNCLAIYTSSGELKFDYPNTKEMLNISKKLRGKSMVREVYDYKDMVSP